MIVNLAFAVRVTVMLSELKAEFPTEYHSSRYIELPVPVERLWNVKCGDEIPWTVALPPAVFMPTRMMTTSGPLVLRLTDKELAKLTLLCAVPFNAGPAAWACCVGDDT